MYILNRISDACDDGTATSGRGSEDGNSPETLLDGQPPSNPQQDTIPPTPNVDPHWDQALFLLKATEQHSLTYSGVESLCESTQGFVEAVLDQVVSKVKEKLREHDISPTLEEDITQLCQPGDLFEGLTSRYSREAYYERHFNYVVSNAVFCTYFKLLYVRGMCIYM